ncbi:MAG TPA: phytanoyl-CoA dioxygenase family protein [Chloroflexota bacterium]|jgi:ectoine hydroxylase-related dioxygenase (phytanoyl-CoA dioxygenase family)|nr:phytanoyl-CoA dioxygenase family protein [Chloroflexota bacterium]
MVLATRPEHVVDASAVDEEAVRAFERNGFLGVRDALGAEETADFLAQVKALEAETARDYFFRENPQYTQHVNVWRTHAGLRRHVFNPRLAEIARRLSRSRRLRLWHDQAIIKQPGGRPTTWHQDLPAWPMIEAGTFTVWIALVDATVASGALQYIPGSHRWGRLAHTTLPREMIESPEGLRWLVPDEQRERLAPVAMELPAGSVTFHHCLMLHGTSPNETGGARYGFIVNYMPEGVRYSGRPHPVLEEGQLATFDPITGPQFPILWSEDASEVARP